jgi:hypothetical protein
MRPEDIQGLIRRVWDCCRETPECVNSDKRLIYEMWKKDYFDACGKEWDLTYSEFKTFTIAESITRARRKAAEVGLIKPSENIQRRRFDDAAAMQYGLFDLVGPE